VSKDERIGDGGDGLVDKWIDGWDEKFANGLRAELDSDDLHFSDEMQSHVLETKAPVPFWAREVRIPIPLFALPLLIIILVGALFLHTAKDPSATAGHPLWTPGGISTTTPTMREG